MNQIGEDLREVRSFWDSAACGTHLVNGSNELGAFYERYRRFRYSTEWHIPLLVPFAAARHKAVLEIGCGNGADGVMFALNGARYTGVDLTETAVEATRRHFASVGMTGTFQVQNAEAMTFPDESFDIVYSYGALHHTPDPARAFAEVFRVLRTDGQAIIMLYHRHSFNYYIRILTMMRLRALLTTCLRLRTWRADARAPARTTVSGIRGNADKQIWSLHYENYLRQGWSYFKAKHFVHHCTDGPECTRAFVFTRAEVRRLLENFRTVEFQVCHFPLSKYRLGRFLPAALEGFLARRVGWYLFAFATK